MEDILNKNLDPVFLQKFEHTLADRKKNLSISKNTQMETQEIMCIDPNISKSIKQQIQILQICDMSDDYQQNKVVLASKFLSLIFEDMDIRPFQNMSFSMKPLETKKTTSFCIE